MWESRFGVCSKEADEGVSLATMLARLVPVALGQVNPDGVTGQENNSGLQGS